MLENEKPCRNCECPETIASTKWVTYAHKCYKEICSNCGVLKYSRVWKAINGGN